MTTPPALYGQFGKTVPFAERTLTATPCQHLAERDTTPEAGYALQPIAPRGPRLTREALSRELEGSRNVNPVSTRELLAQLEAEGLIRGDTELDLTAGRETLYRSLRESLAGPTAQLLGQFGPNDVQTIIRTPVAIAERAAEE
jgi:hypothetical protein